MVIGGSGPKLVAVAFKIAAPVGVVSSASMSLAAIGIPHRISAVAGAGTETRPWAIVIDPVPVGTGEATVDSIPKLCMATADPTMSAIESMAPTS